MEFLAQKISKKIATTLSYDNEHEEVILYGMIAIIQIIVTLFFVIILGLLFEILIESLILTISVSLLRKYSGGVHVSSMELCTAIGLVYNTLFAWLSKNLLAEYMSISGMIIISLAVFLLSYLAIFYLAPVDSPNKPIVTDKKKKKMKKGSYSILTSYLFISILLITFSQNNTFLSGYFLSLIFGILWQISTLTKLGALFIHKIDAIFN